jgi:SAM-dependent methyltransferase
MNTPDAFIWEIELLPFVWGAQETPYNPRGLPDTLPFALSLDTRTGLLIQCPDARVEEALTKAYEVGSVLGSNVAEDGIGRRYADDFLDFISRTLNETYIGQQSVLEIGCGNGYLLSRMSLMFGSAIGVEPGPQGQDGARRYGVHIVQGFFPTPHVTGKYSAIVLMSVLEHVQDPAAFVASLTSYLAPGGRIFISVPNESAYLQNGDVSTLFHEHWSYFDRQTLRATMTLAGLTVVSDCESSFGGSLYACLSAGTDGMKVSDSQREDNVRVALRYLSQARSNCDTLREACERMTADGQSLGVYVPARFVNAIGISHIPAQNIRFFDDDPGLLGTYYPGIPIRIESRDDLLRSPTDSVLIMSRTFGPNLAAELRKLLPASTRVLTVADLLF